MLQEMRKYTKTWFAWLFVIPLVVSFAAWGINDVFRPSTPDVVATVGGTDISVQEFQRQYRLRIRQLGEKRGTPINADEARSMGVGRQLLSDVEAETALTNLAHRMGLAVSDAEVTAQIRSLPEFLLLKIR